MTVDYGTIKKGGEDNWTVTLTDSDGWPEGSDSWTWKLLVAARETPTTLAKALTASNAAITGDNDETMTLTFAISTTDSDALGEGAYYVECEGAEGDATERYYTCVEGYMTVLAPRAGG